MDDMLVKSKVREDHLNDLEETFNTLRKFQLRLNPAKCFFGESSGNFLGHMISNIGIEVNPEKTRALLEMPPPSNIKQVQSLNGRLTSLRRFISKLAERSLPFFQALKEAGKN